ncbi:MAG: arylsulfotransferase family protein [Actinomycetota bacterium]|nr:arylsulfotransferase family protein [Actinomycetota bacterium]
MGCGLLERSRKLRSSHVPKGSPLRAPKRASKVKLISGDGRSAGSENVWSFRSRPDLSPPSVEVTKQAHGDTAPGYIFAAPKGSNLWQGGSMMFDDSGQPVWFRPMQNVNSRAMGFRVQNYRGSPVLTWAEIVAGGDDYVIFDNSYREIARFRAGNGYQGNHHEFLITKRDTALITIANPVPADLSAVGGSKAGMVYEGMVQELDIGSGEVLFEWHSLPAVGPEESYYPLLPDYFHLNSIDVDHDDNLIVSARNTSTVYKIDRKSGEIIWRLGGKRSSFKMGPGTRTHYQHDARRQPDGTISIFDNGATVYAAGVPKGVEESRGIILELDEEQMSASLVREYTHPLHPLALASGDMQALPNENVFIGWGRQDLVDFSEFSRDGKLLFSAGITRDISYRAFRFGWNGYPSERPAAVAERASEEEVKVYASWNGATEVDGWEVFAGPSSRQLRYVGSAPRNGFETAMSVRTAEPYLVVRAKDGSGRVLGTAGPVKL